MRAKTPAKRHRAEEACSPSVQYGVDKVRSRAKITGRSALAPSCFTAGERIILPGDGAVGAVSVRTVEEEEDLESSWAWTMA